MRVLEIPSDVAIGGVERQAERLAEDADAALAEAESLFRALARGERLPPRQPIRRDEAA